MSDHLTVTPTTRGFKTLPATNGRLRHERVFVYESSNAMEPSVWLAVEAPANRNYPDAFEVKQAVVELPVDDARRLAEQLLFLLANHYQNEPEPEGGDPT
jgi:PhoPQ-activated pathogenicity-related protein